MDRVVTMDCIPESVEKIREALLDVKYIDLPVTGRVILPHGGYGRASRFKAKQHRYAGGGYGGCGGFVELLEINDPPDGRWPIVINEYDSEKGSRFHKFASLETAIAAWEKSLYRFDNAPGYIETVECGELDPWFYAVANQAIHEDYAFPNWVCDDPVYRPGKWFIVYDDVHEQDEPKLCLGMHEIEKEKEKGYICIWWSDGSVSRGSRSRLSSLIRPVEFKYADPEAAPPTEILWKQEAYNFMKKVVGGQVDDLVIETPDGKIITVRTEYKSRRHCLGKRTGPQLRIEGGEGRVEAIIRAGHKTVLIGKAAVLREEKANGRDKCGLREESECDGDLEVEDF
jgi:hypothetical protein